MTIGEVLHAAKALVCKERRDSFVDAPDSKSWNEGPPPTIPTPAFEEMDWLAGPEGMEWLSGLRVSADAPDSQANVVSSMETRSRGVADLFNDENKALDANVDRRHAMNMATKGLKALPAKPSKPLPPNDVVAAPRSMTMPESPSKQRFALAPNGQVPQQGHLRSSSFTVARVRHHSRSLSFDGPRRAPAASQPLQPNRSFNLAQAVQASVPLQSVLSFDRPVCADSSSFHHGPPARPVRTPGSFRLGQPVQAVPSRSLSRGPAAPSQSRSVSRGPPCDDAHRAAATRRHIAARVNGRSTNVAMELSRDVSVEVAAPFDDVMPDTGREDASSQLNSARRVQRRKPNSIFWKPPPEAAKLCAAVKMPSFVAPEVASDSVGRTKPPVAPVVGVASNSWFPAPERMQSYGPSPPSASFVPPPLQSRPSFSAANSFVPPARVHSSSFAPSPRGMR